MYVKPDEEKLKENIYEYNGKNINVKMKLLIGTDGLYILRQVYVYIFWLHFLLLHVSQSRLFWYSMSYLL